MNSLTEIYKRYRTELKPVKVVTGIYFLVKNKKIVYIGQSTNVFLRIAYHGSSKDFDDACYFECPREDLDSTERLLIESYLPEYNITFTDRYRQIVGKNKFKIREILEKRVAAKKYDKKTIASMEELGFL